MIFVCCTLVCTLHPLWRCTLLIVSKTRQISVPFLFFAPWKSQSQAVLACLTIGSGQLDIHMVCWCIAWVTHHCTLHQYECWCYSNGARLSRTRAHYIRSSVGVTHMVDGGHVQTRDKAQLGPNCGQTHHTSISDQSLEVYHRQKHWTLRWTRHLHLSINHHHHHHHHHN